MAANNDNGDKVDLSDNACINHTAIKSTRTMLLFFCIRNKKMTKHITDKKKKKKKRKKTKQNKTDKMSTNGY